MRRKKDGTEIMQVHFTIPRNKLDAIDRAARVENRTRSSYIRNRLEQSLKATERLDEA